MGMSQFLSIFLFISLLYSQDQVILKEAEIAYKSKDYPKAFKLYKQMAKIGDAQAFYHLGLMYDLGQYVDLDRDKAIEYFKKAGKMGVVDAYLKLTDRAIDFRGVSCKEAFIYYQKALDLNQKRADVYKSLGNFYLSATSMADCPADYNAYPDKDDRYYQKGMFYLEKAGEMGNFTAYIRLGNGYRRGDPGFVRSYKKAKQYFLKAAEVLEKAGEKGDSQAYNELGLLYKDYDDDPQDILSDGHKSVAYFQKAIALGNTEAYVHMGEYYEYGSSTVYRDDDKAKWYYQKAGELGNAQGYAKLVSMYQGGVYQGGGVGLLRKGMEYLEKAGALGDGYSYEKLGNIYYYGRPTMWADDPYAPHIPKNYKKAAQYFQKCINMGVAHCYYDLAGMYKKGLGVPKNLKKAEALAEHARDIFCDKGMDDLCEGDTEGDTEE
ncbi:tetratricopeptide repeat protein [Helicobacter suis]|uniref:tetratricopeptide repeat protein n=1 Tax=Helicobacter suis TaxID=104628 RepID=UPI0013D74878|nr:tetratricopeptide repeat protein [Helicobacter suis]